MLTILDKNDTWLSTIIPEYIPIKYVLTQRTVLEEYSNQHAEKDTRTDTWHIQMSNGYYFLRYKYAWPAY